MSIKQKVYIKTYGCGMNVYDSERMIDILTPLGYAQTDAPDDADLVIYNTCNIREKAVDKLYSDLGRIKPIKLNRQAENKNLLIAVAGCTAQAEGGEILKRAPYVDMIFGPQSYQGLPEMLARAQRQRDLDSRKQNERRVAGLGILNTDFPEIPKFDHLPEVQKHNGVSALVAIQEGCDKFCHFCSVPYTRGAEYSRPVKDVLNEIKRLAAMGVKEVMLLGQNVNAYHGESLDGQSEWGLGRLIFAIAEIDGIHSIRYTTSHPRDVDDMLIKAHAEVAKLSPFLHLPVQSGSNKVLKSMNRRHTVEFYLDIIEKFKTARPDIAFSSDFIVGYHDEDDQAFNDTLNLIRTVNFAQAYSFKYSPRPGTPGWTRKEEISEEVKDARLQELQALVNKQQFDFNQNSIGKIMSLLLEKAGRREGQFLGRSPYMQSIHVMAHPRLLGSYVQVKITEAHNNSLKGELLMHDQDTPLVKAPHIQVTEKLSCV